MGVCRLPNNLFRAGVLRCASPHRQTGNRAQRLRGCLRDNLDAYPILWTLFVQLLDDAVRNLETLLQRGESVQRTAAFQYGPELRLRSVAGILYLHRHNACKTELRG